MSTMPDKPLPRRPRLAEATLRRARLSLVPARSVRTARAPFVALVALILVGGVSGLLAFNTAMQQSSFRARDLTARAEALAAREQKLELELDELREPQHVAAEAKKLGMVPATSPAFLRLADGRILGEPKAAVALDAMRIDPRPKAKPRDVKQPVLVRRVVLTPAEVRAEARLKRARAEARKARLEARGQRAAADAGASTGATEGTTR